MEISKVLKQALLLIRVHPTIWLLAGLAILGDVWAILSFDPYSVQRSLMIILFSLLTFVAETSILYAFIQHNRESPCSFSDAIMTGVTSPGPIAAKAVLMIIPAAVLIILFILSSILRVVFEEFMIPLMFIGLLLPVLFLLQIWTPFTTCGLLIQQYSIAESITHAWRMIWSHRKTLLQLALVFILIDMMLIALLYFSGGISYESAFIYTVTDQMALMSRDFMTGDPTQAGEFFTINRPFDGVLVTFLKARGIDLLSIPTFFIDKMLTGIGFLVLALFLLPVRLGVLALVYSEWAEPTLEISSEVNEFWREQKTITHKRKML